MLVFIHVASIYISLFQCLSIKTFVNFNIIMTTAMLNESFQNIHKTLNVNVSKQKKLFISTLHKIWKGFAKDSRGAIFIFDGIFFSIWKGKVF
jgi:hypothetical protein